MVSVLSPAVPYLADGLVILGLWVMTVGVYDVIRMPDTYTRLHAASKAVFLGVISLCVPSAVTGDPAIIYRAILIAAFLLVTTPISAYVIARAAFLRGERMKTPGALDESGRDLPEAPGRWPHPVSSASLPVQCLPAPPRPAKACTTERKTAATPSAGTRERASATGRAASSTPTSSTRRGSRWRERPARTWSPPCR